ncbi:MAG TPA: Gfo/Idh/MocA family oxidoreductase [Candidatus Latescibacteria bacterium]|nr:Gfo/Idh/MocA family oxidoreductase [Candidatus Latescibacterota bacterium]HQE60899.1 Gfo/Idh/MocA family oxidoreductase [Candidatus Latescibacterota bacterium]HQI74986.1 Gfo/Idh/MocA family oxidoreductase [Candidatus Latescibacterota bacterium]HQK23724.1 Gfo/Idh/MocA family oxidoreductase [Candidatus Latescibacterota bacterium]HRU23480.1 Gfo/Idh/MocA family oxidoreductase [Candidatus Latescibacterota bacterium]
MKKKTDDKPVRWGILATGNIAKQFARGLQVIPDARLVAVGSRTRKGAEAFAKEFNVPNVHASYEALASDPDVDAVYVATPHPFHRENTILCLNAGKAVLCEKPFAINAREAREMIACARQNNVFLMEAMWTRYLPLYAKVRELLSNGVIGDVRMVKADFCFRADLKPEGRLFNLALGGGGLLDIGVYTISFANMICGPKPERMASLAHIGTTGVDEQAGLLLSYPGDKLAVLTCAVRTTTPHEAAIFGTEGMIRIHHPFWHGSEMTLSVNGKPDVQMSHPFVGNGYNCEAVEVMRCIRSGRKESALMPLDESLAIMETMDAFRSEWGLRYPTE